MSGARTLEGRFEDDVEGINLAIDRDGRMMGVYVARPADGRTCPGVLLLPDAWGMRDAMRDFARRVASAGYVVAMPDLYYHLDWWSESAGREQMLSAKESVEPDRVAADAQQVVATIGTELELAGAWGLVGLCMSGRFSIRTLSAMPETFAAAAILYGTDMLDEGEEGLRGRLSRMRTEFALYYGDQDPWVPLSEIETLRRAFADSGRTYRLHVFPGASHGFAHPTSSNYRQDAADQAWSRTFELFTENLS